MTSIETMNSLHAPIALARSPRTLLGLLINAGGLAIAIGHLGAVLK